MKQEILAPSLGVDHPTVKKVIKIANEMLNEGRVLNIEYLYRRAKRELKIPREGMLTIIQYLVNKKIIINGSKFTKDTILDSDIRNLIYNFLQNNIGLHFSAIKRNGIRLYKLARKGEIVERKPRNVVIKELKFIEYKKPFLKFSTVVSKGTYIRVLAEDIAERLNTVGHLVELQRTRIGDFHINDALKLMELNKENIGNLIKPITNLGDTGILYKMYRN